MKRNIAILGLLLLTSASAVAQDSCALATAIGDGVFPGSNVGMTTGPDPIVTGCGFNNGLDVWYAYTASCTGNATATTCAPGSATFDTVIGIWSGACGTLSTVACNDDFCALQSSVTWPVMAGTVYYISLAGYNGASGSFNLSVSCFVPPPPPLNDDCIAASAIGTGTNPAPAASGNTFNNFSATTTAGYALNCSGVNITKDVWYSFTPAMSGIYQIDTETPAGFTAGSLADTILEVYSAGCVVGPALACDDDAGITGTGLLSIVFVNLVGGSSYDIRIGGYASSTVTEGTFYLNVTFIGPPLTNDDCGGGATPLLLGTNPSPAASGFAYSNAGATTTTGFPAACATIVNDVWFSFTPATSDTFVFDTNTPCGFTAGTMTNTTIALYDSTACSTLGAALACDADSGVGSLSVVSAPLVAGTTYYLRVGATTNVFQTFYVNVTQGGLATNDECANALGVGLGTNPAPGASCNLFRNEGATTSAGWPAICATVVNDVWFTFTPPSTGSYVIDTNNPCGFGAGTVTNTTIAIYSSCTPGAPLACDADSGTGSLSAMNVALTAGTPYYIRVGVTATTGTGTFYLNVNPGTTSLGNDTCATALPISIGTNPSPAASCFTFDNALATTDALPGICAAISNDLWFAFTPATGGDYRFDTETPAGFTAGTNTNTTIAVYASCAATTPLACDADSGVTGNGLMSIVTVPGLVGGNTYYIRVGSTSATTAGTFYLTATKVFSLFFSSPFGPGSLQADIVAGPPNGGYFFCVTLNAGGYPYGYFFGIEPLIQEVINQVTFGFPFTGALSASGDFLIGPVAGLPSGLTLYGVALGFATPVIDYPIANTAPAAYTVP